MTSPLKRAPVGGCAAALVALAVAVGGCQAEAAGPAGKHTSAPSRPADGRSSVSTVARPARCPRVKGHSAGSPRIMIVGDSITKGSAGDYTWQYFLYEHLRADCVSPTMVGPNHSLFNNVTGRDGSLSYANPRFEHDNDAHWGMALIDEKNVIGAKVAKYRPDYLLVLLGLDDIAWLRVSQSGMAANLASFIAAARAARPHIRIVLGLVPPDINQEKIPALAAGVAAFNRTIVSTVARLSTRASPLAVARDSGDFNVPADTWDGTHTNANGDLKIGAAFSDALASRFRLGRAYPRPYPVLPTGPLTRPRLTVTPSSSASAAKLSWTLSPGAGNYRIYLKDVTAGETKFQRLPLPVPWSQDPWTAGLLTPGHTYAFKVQACKGDDCHAFSNVATVTAP